MRNLSSMLWFFLSGINLWFGLQLYQSRKDISWLHQFLNESRRIVIPESYKGQAVVFFIAAGVLFLASIFSLHSSTLIFYNEEELTYQPNKKDQIGPIKWEDIASIDLYSYSFGPKRVGYENNLEIKTKAGETITAGCRYADYIALKKTWEERMK